MEITRISSKFLESNTFIVREKGECIIIDAGVSLDKVKEVVKDSRVVGIFVTHGHYDHSFYIKDYLNEFLCPVYINKAGKNTLVDANINYGKNFKLETDDRFIFLENDVIINCGIFEIKCYSTPGHSPCGECYLIDKDLFAGDTVFYVGVGRTDLLGSNEKDMIASLKKVRDLDFETLHSGHERDSSYQEQQRNLNAYIKFLNRN